METRIIKNIFNKNRRCKDIKTQNVCEQGREENVIPTANSDDKQQVIAVLADYSHCWFLLKSFIKERPHAAIQM